MFISYAREDEIVTRRLYERLRESSCRPWRDREDIPPGSKWETSISKAIRGSDFLILCMSNHSVGKRGFVQKELRMALSVAEEMPEDSIFLLPVRLEECGIPDSFAQYQYVDLFRPDGFQRLMGSIFTEWTRRRRDAQSGGLRTSG